jgi:FlaA1/EpsC-like NDP-sugar epimerase
MLRRHRQLRQQMHRILDVCLFALALWTAHWLRDVLPLQHLSGWIPFVGTWLERKLADPILPFYEYFWLCFIILPLVPVLLEVQGFYKRPLFFSRRQTAWALLKTSILATLTIILAVFLANSQAQVARSVAVFFGVTSFAFLYLKEEIAHWIYKSSFGQTQRNTRLMLLGAKEDTCKLRREIAMKSGAGIEIVAELDLNANSIDDLVHFLHEHSVNGVVINARHTFFGQVEKAIQACELEGVEAWLVADFFKTQISRTSVDDFYGRPMLVFHTGPEASWQGIAKQVVDFTGASVLLGIFSLPMLIAAAAIKLTSRGPVMLIK